MIDVQAVDALFDESQGRVQFALLDKRVLLPPEQVPATVKAEAGEDVSLEFLEEKASLGWLTLVSLDGPNGGCGVPLYVPSRLGLLVKLSRDGWSDDEIRLVVSNEEELIDNVWTQDDLAYIDDDLAVLIRHIGEQLDALESAPVASESDNAPTRLKRELATLQGLQASGIPPHLELPIRKAAFRVRAFNDSLRVWMLEIERSKLQVGYGPTVEFTGHSWDQSSGFHAKGVDWPRTVRATLARMEDGREIPIRVPGFLLRGEHVIPLRTMRPSLYRESWNANDIDGYLRARAEACGERRCLNCHGQLPQSSNEKLRFCRDACRKAAKQRRYRREHPEAVEWAQKRYWESVKLDDGADDH